MSTLNNPKKLRIGVMLEEVQLVDIAGIDIFGNLSDSYVSGVISVDQKYAKFGPHAVSIEFFYIATTLETSFMTPPQPGSDSLGGFKFVPTVTYDDCPRDLDILLIGGPVPSHRPPQADKFMKEAWSKTPVWLTTCIGSIWLASTGLLEGKTCTTNKEFLDMAKQMYPGTNWLRQRWVVEEKEYEGTDGRKGELWTAGGAGAGIDMIAHYCLKRFGHEFVNTMSLEMLELNPGGRYGQFYT
ncbi:class I glutamine amidotransferase-like protein [Stachybotrys elegans]|uniref:Class I glutamine amidotransferase-like protein n=1 Tax=Stachybotrys elegans TaxID=80388 RepID=A0A8K0SGL4_9HYPO|nr:class I glutamine amidotransferase-like protein [Stachybotrys elegans]